MISFGAAVGSPSKGAAMIRHKLKSGQTITLSPGDERMLRSVYDYLQGFKAREQLAMQLEQKRRELAELGVPVEKSTLGTTKSRQASASVNFSSVPKALPDKIKAVQSEELYVGDAQSAKDEYKILEDKLASHMNSDHRISFGDIEAVLLALRVHNPQKRAIEQMIWEVDELADNVICWDEFQLCYRRNIDDVTGNEPSSFFRLVEFLTFDQTRKGFIIEDDCMEILFVRYGSSKLETELRFIFGNNLRSDGGEGIMTFEGYLAACLSRSGRRAPLL